AVTPKFEAAVVDEVAAIWAPYGVDLQRAGLHDPSRAGAIRLSVVLAERADPRMKFNALGSILFLDDVPQPVIMMYPKAIADLVSDTALSGKREAEWPRLFREVVLGRVFGRALAHELGHYLLHERGHSIAGLMRAAQTGFDLVAPDRHPFALTPTEA